MGRVFGVEIVELGAFTMEDQEECSRAETEDLWKIGTFQDS